MTATSTAQRSPLAASDAERARLNLLMEQGEPRRESGSWDGSRTTWPDPKSLPGGLLAVAQFDCAMLPDGMRSWVEDIAERMQTPAEFVAVPAMVAAGSIIGNKLAIRPMERDDWEVVPNLWGCIVGRPGVMKSPAVSAALKPLLRLEALANEQYRSAKEEWEASETERDLRKKATKSAMEKALKANPAADLSGFPSLAEDEPVCRRYKANDTSYQALGELLRQNENGLLVHRDELMSLLRALDREDSSEARGFYLTGWNGSDSYTFDRIARGTNLFVPSVTLSLLGSTQPALLQAYVRGVVGGTGTDDGLLQRFSMIVWPDMPSNWTEHDREPHGPSRDAAFGIFDLLDRRTADDVGAFRDQYDRGLPYLRFDPEAQAEFKEWRRGLEQRIRSDEMQPAMESHLAKYRKLVPALALIYHLSSGATGPVGVSAVLAALSWAEFLESHAQRIYQAGSASAVDGAKAILRGIRRGVLENGFSANDVAHKNWSPIGEDRKRIGDALDLLEDKGYLRTMEATPSPLGGRPTTRYLFNPKGMRA